MLGLEHAGMISVFLVTAALSDRLTLILETNRRDVCVFQRGRWASNKSTAAAVLTLFLGMFAAYASVAYVIGDAGSQHAFAFTAKLAGLESTNLLEHEFGNLAALLLQNLGVVVAIAFLAFLYRSYGAMLVLAWNACVWGFVFSSLAAEGHRSGVLSGTIASLVAYTAVLPHLILESGAYILVALAALFASQSLATYEADDPRLRKTAPVVATLMACGLASLLLGAVAEAYFAPLVFTRITALG